jgi:rubrerythrin
VAKTTGADEKAVLTRLLGRAPDRVVRERMRSTEWCCDGCGEVFKTGEPIPCPAPCPTCGGIAFTAPH